MKRTVALATLPLAWSLSCGQPSDQGAAPSGQVNLAGKRVLMIIANRNYRDEELDEPRAALTAAGAKVVVAATTVQPASGMLGGKATPDLALSAVSVGDYDAVVFVGGSGASVYWDDATAHGLAQEAAKQGKIVAAICIAPVTLANAGLLAGRKATVFRSEASKIKAKGANYTGRGVERDGKIITADGPGSARAFGQAIAQALAE